MTKLIHLTLLLSMLSGLNALASGKPNMKAVADSDNLCVLAIGHGERESTIAVSSTGGFNIIGMTDREAVSLGEAREDDLAAISLFPMAHEILRDAPSMKQLAWFTTKTRNIPDAVSDLIPVGAPRLLADGYRYVQSDEISVIEIALNSGAPGETATYADIAILFPSAVEFRAGVTSLQQLFRARGANGRSPSLRLNFDPSTRTIRVPALDLSNVYNRAFLEAAIKRFGPAPKLQAAD